MSGDQLPRIPEPLQEGDLIRVIAPAYSLGIISSEIKNIATTRLQESFGLEVSFGENAMQLDELNSSPIEARVDDLHEAFLDSRVKAVFSAIGGYNSNQLLAHIDWEIIRDNPKVLCGFSDITSLGNAIVQKAGLVTYSGPHYSSFGQRKFDSYTADYMKKALFGDKAFTVTPSPEWTDDTWYLDQDARHPHPNDGHWVIQPGDARGLIVGGNLSTYNLLQGSEYFPAFPRPIAFIEDTALSDVGTFDRDLQSLLHAQEIGGLVIGKFQAAGTINHRAITQIIASKRELHDVPVVANVNFGHTMPILTIPLGGVAELHITEDNADILILNNTGDN